MTQRRAVSAGTRDTNTPETDLQEKVWHIVTDQNGTEFELLAACPMTALDAFNTGEGIMLRKNTNLNRSITNYSVYPEEQEAYTAMQESAFLVAARLLQQAPGAYAEILGSWWWVSPCQDRLEVVCSPDENFKNPEKCNMLLVSGFEGQSADDLRNTTAALDEWIKSPDIRFGNQAEMDHLVAYWTAPGHGLPNLSLPSRAAASL